MGDSGHFGRGFEGGGEGEGDADDSQRVGAHETAVGGGLAGGFEPVLQGGEGGRGGVGGGQDDLIEKGRGSVWDG